MNDFEKLVWLQSKVDTLTIDRANLQAIVRKKDRQMDVLHQIVREMEDELGFYWGGNDV